MCEAGTLCALPVHLPALAIASAWTGDFAVAAALVKEAEGADDSVSLVEVMSAARGHHHDHHEQ